MPSGSLKDRVAIVVIDSKVPLSMSTRTLEPRANQPTPFSSSLSDLHNFTPSSFSRMSIDWMVEFSTGKFCEEQSVRTDAIGLWST